jgi:hypothetical protein
MSTSQSNNPKESGNGGDQRSTASGDAGGEGMHQCSSCASFRTATPDSTFGHPLQRIARPVTRDPAADLRKCASTASIRTLAPEPEFGHQLHRCAKRMGQIKEEDSNKKDKDAGKENVHESSSLPTEEGREDNAK